MTATTYFNCFYAETSLRLRCPGPWMMIASKCFNYEIGNLWRFREASDKNKLSCNWDWSEMKGVHRAVNSEAPVNYYANILADCDRCSTGEKIPRIPKRQEVRLLIMKLCFPWPWSWALMQMQSSLDAFDVSIERQSCWNLYEFLQISFNEFLLKICKAWPLPPQRSRDPQNLATNWPVTNAAKLSTKN